ncbi:MAG: GTP cyclohydrolase, FolE2/MptA family [Conexivisphaera sp.]
MDWEDVVRRSRDVQYGRPDVVARVPRAGVRGLMVPLAGIPEGPVRLAEGSVDALVDLPPTMRGANMSRSVRAILGALEGAGSLAGFASAAAAGLLELHEYSSVAVVRVRASAFAEVEAPASGLRSPCRFTALAGARAARGSGTRASLGVSVVGAIACPCGSELMRSAYGQRDPPPTHMQRASLTIEATPASHTSIASLRSAALSAFSAEVRPLMKRSDEAATIDAALSRPRFAEDAFRLAALSFAAAHPSFPRDGSVRIRVRSMESVHGHDVVAEGTLTGEELLSLGRV